VRSWVVCETVVKFEHLLHIHVSKTQLLPEDSFILWRFAELCSKSVDGNKETNRLGERSIMSDRFQKKKFVVKPYQ
jgi:hypothetical protein